MTGRVEDKVALVTGAGSGIGRAVAIRLAEEGARVVVTSRSPDHVVETAELVASVGGHPPVSRTLDMTDPAAIAESVRAITDQLGSIDIISNNAGVDDPDGHPVSSTPDHVWDDTLAVNLSSVFWMCRAAIPAMTDGGAIVNMGSGNGVVPRPNAAAYCVSKAGLLSLTRCLALELASRHIRVNCVCPGVTDTPLTDLFLSLTADPAASRIEYAQSNPLQRIADAREIANAVLFLASDESSFVTGTTLVVDGGGLA